MGQFLMPKLSDTMEEGTVLQWLAADGEEVTRGQPLVEVETDKATMTVDAPEDGRLHLMAAEGDVLPVGAPIAAIGDAAPLVEVPADRDEEAEQTNIPVGDDGTMAEIGAEVALPGEERYPAAHDGDDAEVPAVAQVPPAPAPPEPVAAVPALDGDERVKASPLARRLARELGVEMARVRGSGPDGRIVRADVEAAASGDTAALRTERPPPVPAAVPVAAPTPVAAAPPPAAAVEPGARTSLNRLQQTIARRMVESTTEAPHFFLQRDVDATEAAVLRRELVEAAEGPGPSLNDLIVRAVALAAADDMTALRRYDGDALVDADGVHVGVAVTVPDGLMVPVVRDADRKTVGQIAAEVRNLAERARSGAITPPELEGSTISVSNLGMYGVDRFSAVINPPEPAILAVGRAAPRPVARDGEVVVRDVMTLTLSVDHRALYGAEAAVLLGRIAELLERPHALVL